MEEVVNHVEADEQPYCNASSMEVGPPRCPIGGGFKPPYSVLAKVCRAKQYGKVRAWTLSGISQEDERKRITVEAFEIGMDDAETGGFRTSNST